jgi:hypothetical protein
MPGALSHNKFVSDPVIPSVPTAKSIVILVRAAG